MKNICKTRKQCAKVATFFLSIKFLSNTTKSFKNMPKKVKLFTKVLMRRRRSKSRYRRRRVMEEGEERGV